MYNVPFDISGRRVVITGAGRGLGRVLALAFDKAGAHLGLVARSKRSLDEVAEEMGDDVLICPGDVRDAEFNEQVAATMTDRFGGVDVWICNAGISPEIRSVTDTAPETWREIIDTNLTGTFLGARAAAAVMGRGGRIIVTSSVLGDHPRAGLAAYSSSKGGTNSFVRALAQELGPRGITANAVALGWFDTGLGAHWQRNEDRVAEIAEHTALKRWGTPPDLPGIFLFLASEASAYVTGATINVDGGYALI